SLKVDIGADPIVWRRSMALPGEVLGEECIARAKGYAGAVAQTNIDRTRKSNDPAAARRAMPIYYVRRKTVSEQQTLGVAGSIEEFRGLACVQLLEMGLAVIAAI